jgi:preprotein translocase SecE subunit
VARDRDKAKARRAERKAARGNNPGPRPSEPHREMVPGSLDHASGEVDQFENRLIAGAEGEPADLDGDGQVDEQDAAELERQALAAAPAAARAEVPATTEHRGPFARFGSFLRASWAELQRVQWPDRRQVGQGTAVVLGFVIIAGLYLGLADEVAKRFVNLIL